MPAVSLRGCAAVFAGAVFSIHSSVYAGLCLPPVVKEESAYAYMLSLTDALGYAKTGLDRTPRTDAEPYNLLLGFKLAKADYDCAASKVLPYAASTNKAIRTSAKGVALVFGKLAALSDESVSNYKTLLNNAGKGEIELGTAFERQAELGALYDETWKLLIPAVIAGTYAIIEEDPATKLMSGLALTAPQRDEILGKLRTIFGDEITNGIHAGQPSLVAAAAALYQVLGLQGRRPRGQ